MAKKKINPEDVDLMIVCQNYNGVRRALEAGFDINTRIPGKIPIVESAQPAEDPKMLRILWEADARPTTPWLKEVFADFENGGDGSSVIRPRLEDKTDLEDLTNTFTVAKLSPISGTLRFAGAGSAIDIQLKPFVLDDERIDTSISLDLIELPERLAGIENKKFKFPISPNEGYIDGSMFLYHAHHPVDVTEIHFGKLSNDKKSIPVRLKMAFNFQYEGSRFANEKAVWKVELQDTKRASPRQ